MNKAARQKKIAHVGTALVRPLVVLFIFTITTFSLLTIPGEAQEPGSENVAIVDRKLVVIFPPHTRGRYVVQRRPQFVDVRASGWRCAVFGEQVDTNFNLGERVAGAIRRLTNPTTVLAPIPANIRSRSGYAFLQSVLNLHQVSDAPVRYANNRLVRIDLSSSFREARFLDCFLSSDFDRLKAAYLEAFDTALSLRQ